jgi:hypothetical protein
MMPAYRDWASGAARLHQYARLSTGTSRQSLAMARNARRKTQLVDLLMLAPALQIWNLPVMTRSCGRYSRRNCRSGAAG